MTDPDGNERGVPRFVRRYVAFLSRRAGLIVLGAFVLFILSALAAARLELHSDFTELLPQDDLELRELRQIADKVGGASNIIVGVEGPDPAANQRFAEALVKNLQPLMGKDLRAIDYRADESRAFFEHNRVLYADLIDLKRTQDDLKKLLVSSKNPAFITFADDSLGEENDDPHKDLRLLEKKLKHRADNYGRFASGYYESEDRKLLAIVAWTNSSGLGDQSGFTIRDDVQKAIDLTQPASFGAVSAHVTGDVPSAIEEHDALKADIQRVSLVCTVLVLLVVTLYYRSVISLANIFFPTLLGVGMAFGITALTIGYLNTNTAFLGSIILGNGINFGIIMLARYREERRTNADSTTEDGLRVAIGQTAKPTLTAALTAGIAYGSLAFTHFRGFRQFGEVGGIGMVLCWLLTYSYGPALILFWERLRPLRPFAHRAAPAGAVRAAAWFLRAPKLTLGIVVLISAVAAWLVVPLVRDPFEYDFSKLRNQESRKHGVGDLYVRVGRIFPQDLAPVGVALLSQASDAPAYDDALLAKDCADGLTRAGDVRAREPRLLQAECARRVKAGEPTGGLLSAVAIAHDYLPKDQEAKFVVVGELRRLLADPAMEALSPEDRKQLDTWAPPADLRPLVLADLPDAIARRFREVDGTVGRLALIFPVRVWANWDGHALMRLSEVIKNVRLPNGVMIDAAGQSSLFAAMLRSIGHDGPIATYIALLGVVLAVVLLFRRRRPIFLVLMSLLLAVLWMGAAGAVLGLKLNFLNFVVLPITLGIGVDYAVNIFARLETEPHDDHPRALLETGSAVALCSSTTIIGYSSLLISSNGALRSFGKLADAGEVACLLAALLLVPAIVRGRRLAAPTRSPAAPAATATPPT